MNFSDLKTEFFARGTNYLEESGIEVARAERWLNEAYRIILNLQAWPFLRTVATGSAGTGLVSVPDLRRIRFVTDKSQDPASSVPGRPLDRALEDDLVGYGYDLSTTGTPEVYYVVNGNEVRTFPLGGTIRVDYIRRVAPMSGTDEPIFDEEYHNLIVDRAMMKAYADSDNFEARSALKEEFDEGAAAMAEDYQVDSREVVFMEPSGDDV